MKRLIRLAVPAVFLVGLASGCGEDPGAAVPAGLDAAGAKPAEAAAPAAASGKAKGVSGIEPVGPAD